MDIEQSSPRIAFHTVSKNTVCSRLCRMGYHSGNVRKRYKWRWDEIVDVNRFRYCLSGSSDSGLTADSGKAAGGREGDNAQWGPHGVSLDELIQYEGGQCLKVDGVLATGVAANCKPITEGQCPFDGECFPLSNDTNKYHEIDAGELERARAIDAKVLSFSTGFNLTIEGYSVGDTYPPFPLQPDCNDLWSPPPAVMSVVENIVEDFSRGKPYVAIHWRR